MTDRAGERVGGIGTGISGQCEQPADHVLHLFFFAWPLPTTACFTWSAVYSATGRPAITAAQIAVPRAWPSSNVDCGLT
jgi:hypothetical protein